MPSADNAKPMANECLNVIDAWNKQGNEIQSEAEPYSVKDPRKSNQLDTVTLRVTILMVTVTVVFIVSFLPYLSFVLWSAIEGRGEALFLSEADFVAVHIGGRSYLLHSALNPWIYGIFNNQFRKFFFRGCFRKHG